MSDLPEYLGGQNAGTVDLGVAQTLVDIGYKSLLDIGCGDGFAPLAYAELGLEVVGVDGDWTRLPQDGPFLLHDFTKGLLRLPPFDVAYSIEFLEHLDERYLPNVAPLFQNCKVAVVTAALPNQPGHHHVNCQPPEYWHDIFRDWGLAFDAYLTDRLKKASTMKKATGIRAGKPIGFFRRTGMVFKNGV